MLVVPVEIRPSLIHGYGVYTTAPIKEKDLVWVYVDGFDTTYTKAQILSMPYQAQQYLYYKMWKHKDREGYCVPRDEFTYINHWEKPNITFPAPYLGLAAKDIDIGEELLVNYLDFDWKDAPGDDVWEKIQENCGFVTDPFDTVVYNVK